jgi:hypothetical protein
MRDNHCALVNLMGICVEHDEYCIYFVRDGDTTCMYYASGKCCHALAICTSTMKDNRSQRELKHLLNGL